jgi:hypothetical protein
MILLSAYFRKVSIRNFTVDTSLCRAMIRPVSSQQERKERI